MSISEKEFLLYLVNRQKEIIVAENESAAPNIAISLLENQEFFNWIFSEYGKEYIRKIRTEMPKKDKRNILLLVNKWLEKLKHYSAQESL